MKTVCFRGGCLTGPGHSEAQLHGFLAYLVKCAVTDTPYVVFGYDGKQVRDNIDSFDLVNAFWHFFQAPRSSEVYNIGGGRYCNCSMLEAIEKCQDLTGRKMRWTYTDVNRARDHIWWISDIRRFPGALPRLVDALRYRRHHGRDLRGDERPDIAVGGDVMPLQVKSLAEWEREGITDMLSIVIPAHNEEGHIAETVEGLSRRSKKQTFVTRSW
jgi:hypothetical protein